MTSELKITNRKVSKDYNKLFEDKSVTFNQITFRQIMMLDLSAEENNVLCYFFTNKDTFDVTPYRYVEACFRKKNLQRTAQTFEKLLSLGYLKIENGRYKIDVLKIDAQAKANQNLKKMKKVTQSNQDNSLDTESNQNDVEEGSEEFTESLKLVTEGNQDSTESNRKKDTEGTLYYINNNIKEDISTISLEDQEEKISVDDIFSNNDIFITVAVPEEMNEVNSSPNRNEVPEAKKYSEQEQQLLQIFSKSLEQDLIDIEHILKFGRNDALSTLDTFFDRYPNWKADLYRIGTDSFIKHISAKYPDDCDQFLCDLIVAYRTMK